MDLLDQIRAIRDEEAFAASMPNVGSIAGESTVPDLSGIALLEQRAREVVSLATDAEVLAAYDRAAMDIDGQVNLLLAEVEHRGLRRKPPLGET